jgi:L-ascorbate metabolism protein UlaG (beta-lactamase superfamily)
MKSPELSVALKRASIFVYLISIFIPLQVIAHNNETTATYLANEGVMIAVGDVKVLFDPFFHNDYGTYQLVPEKIMNAIMSNAAPYDNISAIFVSHAHGDHFAEQDMLAYMLKHPAVQLVAPTQAIAEMQKLAQFDKIKDRITAIDLAYKDKPISFTLDVTKMNSTNATKVKLDGIETDSIKVDAVRIPHAGWPGRAEVSNIVYRVTMPTQHSALANQHEQPTFIHMGDADPNDVHFRPLTDFWNLQETTVAFPPYWFFLNSTGNYILDYRINAEKSIGVHVPKQIPASLIRSEKAYFSVPGEIFKIQSEAHK